jgi:hypothetical protein
MSPCSNSAGSAMDLSPAAFVISALGGLTETARAIGRPVTTVQGWKDRGRIPQDYWLELIGAGQTLGVTIEVADFLKNHPASEPAAETDEAAA